MSDDLNLPASLQRLEITPERLEASNKSEDNNPFSVLSVCEDQPECFLVNLSLKAVCSKGNCQCNKKKENKEEDEVMKKLKRTQRRPVLRRSRLNSALLRAPVLKLDDITQTVCAEKSQALPELSPKSEKLYPIKALRDEVSESCTVQNQGSGKSLLRAPVLRIDPQRKLPHHQSVSTRSVTEEAPAHRPSAMCAVQARNPSPDDTNIEELASYFDLFVHIPKKMSVMAEMMYI